MMISGMLKALKHGDGWAFALFAAVCAAPFFAPFSRLDFSPEGHIDRGMLFVLMLMVFVLARAAAVVGKREFGTSSAWIWLSGLCCVPLFSTLAVAFVLYIESESKQLFMEKYGLVARSLPLHFADIWSGSIGLFVIWIAVTFLCVGPICLAGTAIFAGLHWLFRATADALLTKDG